MKRIKMIIYIITALFLLILFLHALKRAPVQELPTSRNGIEITMKQEVYQPSTKEIGITIHNHRETEYTGIGGGKFPIDKYFAGSWYKVPFKSDTYTSQGISIPPRETIEMYTEAIELDAELTPGKYRARYGSLAVPFEVKE